MASLFVLASITLAAFLGCCHADLINDFCAESKFISPSRCTKILRSDPRSHGADLPTLGQIAINKTKVAVTNIAKVAMSVRNRNNTGAVDDCIHTCRLSILMLSSIAKLITMDLEERRKGDLGMELLTVAFEIDTSDVGFEDGITKGGSPAKLKRAIRRADGLMHVVYTIVQLY